MLIATSNSASRRRRRRVAKGLRNTVRSAVERPWPLTSAIPVQRRAVLDDATLMLQIAAELEACDSVSERGVERIEDLLRHGDSPVYSPAAAGALHDALTHAHAALHLR
jgi:hypothetical protein